MVAVVAKVTRPTLVDVSPTSMSLTKSSMNLRMKFQLSHVTSVPYWNFGSLSQMLPDPSTTKTRSNAWPTQSK